METTPKKEGRSPAPFLITIALLLALGAFIAVQGEKAVEKKAEYSKEIVAQELKDRALYNYKVIVQDDNPGTYFCNKPPDILGPIVILYDEKQARMFCFINHSVKIEVLHEPEPEWVPRSP